MTIEQSRPSRTVRSAFCHRLAPALHLTPPATSSLARLPQLATREDNDDEPSFLVWDRLFGDLLLSNRFGESEYLCRRL